VNREKPSKSGGMFWAWVPAGLLGSMLVGLGSMAYVAIDDPSFALEPDYYDKAVHWDRSQAEARASQVLGFQLQPTRTLTVASDGTVEVELTLRDRQDNPLSGAQIRLEAFPNAAAARIESRDLQEAAPGVYQTRLRNGTTGLWELRCVVSHGAARYRQVLRLEISKGRA
jgi:hypothetical protein